MKNTKKGSKVVFDLSDFESQQIDYLQQTETTHNGHKLCKWIKK